MVSKSWQLHGILFSYFSYSFLFFCYFVELGIWSFKIVLTDNSIYKN